MTEKTKIISNGKLDKTGLIKIGKSFLISLAAFAIAFLADLTNVVDFGNFQSLMVVFLPWIVNILKVWLGKYESKQ
jgi:hypothetical protein